MQTDGGDRSEVPFSPTIFATGASPSEFRVYDKGCHNILYRVRGIGRVFVGRLFVFFRGRSILDTSNNNLKFTFYKRSIDERKLKYT